MVREPDATMQPTPQDNQLMSKHRVLSLKPQLRLEWRGQHGQSETYQPDHSASLGDSSAPSTRIGFSVHTGPGTPATRSLGGTGCRATWQCTHSIGSAAVKGKCPVNISERGTPKPQTSLPDPTQPSLPP